MSSFSFPQRKALVRAVSSAFWAEVLGGKGAAAAAAYKQTNKHKTQEQPVSLKSIWHFLRGCPHQPETQTRLTLSSRHCPETVASASKCCDSG